MRPYLRYALFVIAGLALVMMFTRRPSGPRVGAEASTFELPLVNSSSRFNLAGERGRPVLIEVFASWCSACRASAPLLSDAARAERARPVRFLGISTDDNAEQARRAMTNWDIPYDVALDNGSFAQAYRITLLPTIVLIDAEGRVKRVSSGRPDEAELEGWLADLGAARR